MIHHKMLCLSLINIFCNLQRAALPFQWCDNEVKLLSLSSTTVHVFAFDTSRIANLLDVFAWLGHAPVIVAHLECMFYHSSYLIYSRCPLTKLIFTLSFV